MKSDHPLEDVFVATKHSELRRAVAAVRRDGGRQFALGPADVRPLSSEEILHLERLGNTAEAWARVWVAADFNWRRVRQVQFHGDVVLGRFTAPVQVDEGIELPSGIYRSTVANCVIGNDVLVSDVKLLSGYVVGEGALVWDCGSVVCTGTTTFGNGQRLPLGIENGGRDVPVYAEMTLEMADFLTRAPARQLHLERYEHILADYLTQVDSTRGIIERGALLRHTPRIHNTYIGPFAILDGATVVEESTLLSHEDEPVEVRDGSCVRRSLLQWGSRVEEMALVERSVLMEYAKAHRQGRVTDSMVGPNSVVSQGEATACLIGPFVSFHHQALLIGVLWPGGKGNVGHGAQVGSNHTSRAPDQECWLGEGMFLGLGASIKYPADLSGAPYSVLASGVTLLPQKLRFPFALVNTASKHWPEMSPAYNELVPAWVLSDNLFALWRNPIKFRARDRCRRQRFGFDVFRPDIVDLMRDACRRLEAVSPLKEVYTERDVDGLGKNYLEEPRRQQAIRAYRFFTRYYALFGLLEQVQNCLDEQTAGDINRWLATPSRNARWEHQRRLLVEELEVWDVCTGLHELLEHLEKIARDVEQSKARDDERGPRIIDDYCVVHVPAHHDPVVVQTWQETRGRQIQVQALLERLHSLPSPDAVAGIARTG